jgi:hypothetical protein
MQRTRGHAVSEHIGAVAHAAALPKEPAAPIGQVLCDSREPTPGIIAVGRDTITSIQTIPRDPDGEPGRVHHVLRSSGLRL